MAKKNVFSPASIDCLTTGALTDSLTPGLKIEVRSDGRKVWRYSRRMARTRILVRLTYGYYPALSIAAAREWASALNEKIEAGVDPREEIRRAQLHDTMTVSRAHGLYMQAVGEGRASRAKRKNKPRTVRDKQAIFDLDIAPAIGSRSIYDVTERDLIDIVMKKGRTARVRANRLAAELKVFFGWAAGLRGLSVGLETDPSRRLGDLRFPETARTRKLSLQEIEWFLAGVAEEPEHFRRGLLLSLLTATRISEVIGARTDEIEDGLWTIPAERVKNGHAHAIRLGPWGRNLFASSSEWVFPAERVQGPRLQGWYEARDRVLVRMTDIAGRPVEHFTPHDFRRTARSNTKRLRVDYETAEAMLNHLKVGLERIYDGYELEEEKASWFLRWENEIISLARKAGVADKLRIPEQGDASIQASPPSPESARVQPSINLGQLKPWTPAIGRAVVAQIQFGGEAGRTNAAQAIDLAPR